MYILYVDSEFAAGRYTEAKRASDNAKNINEAGIAIGLFIMYINIVIVPTILAINFSY